MKMSEVFLSRYLKAEQIGQRKVPVTIRDVVLEDVGDGDHKEMKPILYFNGKDQGMVLNRTNADRLTLFFGSDDSDTWIGRQIIIATEVVDFKGKATRGLRVQEAPQQPQPQASLQPGHAVRPDPAQTPAPLPSAPATYQAAQAAGMVEPLEDDVPF